MDRYERTYILSTRLPLPQEPYDALVIHEVDHIPGYSSILDARGSLLGFSRTPLINYPHIFDRHNRNAVILHAEEHAMPVGYPYTCVILLLMTLSSSGTKLC